MSERKPPSEVMDRSGVNTDVARFRDTEYIIRFTACTGCICPNCDSGEVYQPMQTLDMPMCLRCLMCGTFAPSRRFTITDK